MNFKYLNMALTKLTKLTKEHFQAFLFLDNVRSTQVYSDGSDNAEKFDQKNSCDQLLLKDIKKLRRDKIIFLNKIFHNFFSSYTYSI